MSKHECPVVRIEMKPHPNADALSIMEILGWEVCLRTEEWTNGQLAVYVPPDYVVPVEGPYAELFRWLKGNSDTDHWRRVRSRKFRGRYSHGILVPVEGKRFTEGKGFSVGDDVMETLGIKRYEPPLPADAGGEDERGPKGFFPTYDVENIQRFRHCLPPEVEVIITEKLHGESSRFTFAWEDRNYFDKQGRHILEEGRMYASSHTRWKKQSDENTWWRVLEQNPWIERWCRDNPGLVLYGETFGYTKNFLYGAKPGQKLFRVFDILDKDRWMEVDEIAQKDNWKGLLWVPTLYRGPFDEAKALELALGDSSIPGAKHMREGVVIRCIPEKYDPELGRVQLKLVSPRYLAKG